LKKHPLFSRLVLVLVCLACLCATLFVSAGIAAGLQATLRTASDPTLSSRLAVLQLLQVLLALMFLLGCGATLRIARKMLVVRTDFALERLNRHVFGATVAWDEGVDEVDRLHRALDGVSTQLACHLAEGERLSRQASEHERFATRTLEFICQASLCLAEHSASAPWLNSLLEDMADCLTVRACALVLLEPVAEGLGVPARLGDVRRLQLLEAFSVEELSRGNGRHRASTAAEGEHVELAVPVRDASDTYGVLIVEAPGDFMFESRHSRLIEAVASLFALSLGNLQRNHRRRRLALMDERSAIAGELHDSLAQALSYMKLQVARLQLEIGRSCAACGPGERVLEVSGEIKNGLDSAYRHLRELLSAFRTSMPPGGLQQALREVVDELSARSSTELGFDYRLGSRHLSVNEEFHLLQIVREALTNVVRHARAQHALVRFDEEDDGEIVLMVEDDGRGLRAGSGGDGHHGVSIMRDRARQIGGALHLRPAASGQGTCVEMRFRPRPGSA
jgi:two-component system nitrate/nitrite sensor histidine kinase NarX